MSVAHRAIEAQGVRLHVTMRGEGPPLLLLHGFTGGGDSLGVMVDTLAETRRIVAPDLVGHGRSEAPDAVEPYTMSACVSQLVGILDVLSIPRTDVFGYSMGGRTALSLCASHPDRVGRAVLVGASAGLATLEEREDRVTRDTALAEEIERDGVAAFAERWARLPLFETQLRRLSERERIDARRTREGNTARGLANSLRGMGTGAQPPLHAALPHIDTPVLCLAGSDDPKFRAIAEALARALPHGHAEIIPDAGHAAHLENPKATAAATLAFVGPAPREASSPVRTDTARPA